jgi:thymidine kinase
VLKKFDFFSVKLYYGHMCKLAFYYSSMNSGKSLAVLTKNYMLREKGFRTVLMKPAVDTRTDHTIATRLGIEAECSVLAPDELPSTRVLHSAADKPDYVLVDEAQFLSAEQIWDLANLVDNWGINVYCYGLRLDWQGNFFTGSETLFKIADNIEAIENICKYTGAPAYFHIKLAGTDASVEVGAEDMYESVSRKRWREWQKNKA